MSNKKSDTQRTAHYLPVLSSGHHAQPCPGHSQCQQSLQRFYFSIKYFLKHSGPDLIIMLAQENVCYPGNQSSLCWYQWWVGWEMSRDRGIWELQKKVKSLVCFKVIRSIFINWTWTQKFCIIVILGELKKGLVWS